MTNKLVQMKLMNNNLKIEPELILEETTKKKFKLDKKWMVILIILIILIIIGATLLIVLKNRKLITPNTGESAVENVGQEEKVIRNGKMILQMNEKDLKVGEEFEVKILIDTQDSNIVVASAEINYDSEVLELTEINQEDSVLNMSIFKKESLGKIEITRGAIGDVDYNDSDDGYNGNDGKIFSLNFKILKIGETEIKFEQKNSELILDDGKGTAMISTFEDLNLNIK